MGFHPVNFPDGLTHILALGQGGEGDVFRAWQASTGRQVVLKRSRTAAGALRLREEAKLYSTLAGLPVPGLLSFEDHPRHASLLLEWIDGVCVAQIPLERLSVNEKRAIFQEICRSVAKLHGANVVHGDLSRANLLALASGGIQVIDLGVARRLGESSPSTALGAWEVVAPEVLKGESSTLASDVYALGCLGLFLLGDLPPELTSSRQDWCSQGQSGELARRASLVHPVLGAALQVDPALRPVDAADLFGCLEWERLRWPGAVLDEVRRQWNDRLLSNAVDRCVSQKDWECAWFWQKERVERADDPQELLAQLSQLAHRKASAGIRLRWYQGILALSGVLLVVLGLILFNQYFRPKGESIRLDSLKTSDSEFDSSVYSYSTLMEEGRLHPYQVGPQPPDAHLWIDGQPEEMPDDDTLWLEPGDYRIEIRDASGNLIRDTVVIVRMPRLRSRHNGLPVNGAK
jgi:serine/threonine protein kinase